MQSNYYRKVGFSEEKSLISSIVSFLRRNTTQLLQVIRILSGVLNEKSKRPLRDLLEIGEQKSKLRSLTRLS